MARWYHGTSETNMISILETWFIPKRGIWGKGVYFTSSREGATIFGPCTLVTQIPEEEITKIIYDEWIQRYPNQVTWTKEINKLKSKAISVHYRHSNEIELCVFDTEIIKQIFY